MYHAVLLTTVLSGLVAAAPSREWSDSTGKYHLKADLIAQSNELAVLQRENETLVAVPIAKLSKEDQEYLKSKEVQDNAQRSADQVHTWTMASGLKVRGKAVDYARKEITFQRRRGKIYVNDKLFANLPEIYRRMAPKIVAHFENIDIPDEKAFEAWVGRQLGQPKTYTVEGVILELENGDEYGVPFFLFSEPDLKVLQPGWQHWLAAAKKPKPGAGGQVGDGTAGSQGTQDQQAFLLQSATQAYQQNQRVNQQIALMQLQMQAVDAGATSLWEVQMYPGRGVMGMPLCVVVPGRDSRAAAMEAQRQNPGYVAGSVGKVSRTR